MPSIPIVQNSVGVTTGLSSALASPDAFGAAAGAGLAQFGAGIDVAKQQLEAFAKTQRASDVSAKVAQADYSPEYLKLKQTAPSDAAGFYDGVKEHYSKWVDDYTGQIADDATRKQVREQLIARTPNWTAQAASFQQTQMYTHGKNEADKGLTTLENKVRADPAQYDQAVKDGFAVIDGRAELPQAQREQMKELFRQNATRGRLEAQAQAATTPDEVDAIKAELEKEGGNWQKYMSAPDYARISSSLDSVKKTLQTEENSKAKAAIDGLSERTTNGQVIDTAELAAVGKLVKSSKNPAHLWTFGDINMKQTLMRDYPPGTPPEVLRDAQKIYASGSAFGGRANGLPAPVATAVNEAAQLTGISGAYLAGVVGKEANKGKMARGDFAFGNDAGASSAVGVTQMTAGTWLGLLRNGGGAGAKLMGIDLAGKSEEELLALRGDPRLNVIGSALLAKQNKAAMEGALGRSVTDGELYAAHFLGAGGGRSPGAIELLKLVRDNPDAIAAETFGAAAAANRSIFYADKGQGAARSARDVYAVITHGVMGSTSRASFSASEFLDNRVKKEDAARKDNLAEYMGSTNKWAMNPLNAGSGPQDYAARGAAIQAAVQQYGMVMDDAKPLTKNEVGAMAATIREGTSDEVVGLMARLQGLGSGVAKAAYKQLGETDSVFEYAAGLASDRGRSATATDIVAGQRRLERDKTIKEDMGAKSADMLQEFNSVVGRSLMQLDSRAAAQIRDAALAHFAETYVGRGAGRLGVFDSAAREAYRKSLDTVLGGGREGAAVGAVNGVPTVLPPGVSAQQMDKAVDNFTTTDLLSLSRDGAPPAYADGAQATPDEIAREGQFRAIGGGVYRIQMADGRFLISARMGDRGKPYELVADPAKIKEIAARANNAPPAAQPSGSSVLLRDPKQAPPLPGDPARLYPGVEPGGLM